MKKIFVENKEKKLEVDLEFINFNEALNFVNIIWKIAEHENHYPDIFLHSYN